MQAGREAHDRQVHQSASHVVSSGAAVAAVRAPVVDGDRGGVDDGERAGVGGLGDR